jgi:glycosyltransferase involved in cell wall biosynthesis
VITLKLGWYKIVDATRGVPFGPVIHYLLFMPFVFLRKLLNGKLLYSLGIFDGIYLFDFVDSDIFPKNSGPVIVGTHNQKMGPLKVKAINLGLLMKRANGIRLFDSESIYLPLIHEKKVKIIPKGVNTDLFYPRNDGINDKVKFLYVARLEPKKGIEILLEAWEKSQAYKDAELYIVGTGRLSEKVKNMNIKGMIYCGPLYDNDLQEMYRNCDVFVFPTEWDAQPTVIVEAVASGLYTLCSDHMKGVYDDFQELGYLRYVHNEVSYFAESIKEASRMKYDDFDLRWKMHNFVAEKRSQKKEVLSILSFMSELTQKT